MTAESAARTAQAPRVTRSRGLMILRYRRLMTGANWGRMRVSLALAAANGVFSGFALLALMPAAVALASGGSCWGLGFTGWLAVLAVDAVLAAVCDFAGQSIGFVGTLGFMHDVHHVVGDRIARLPLRWFGPDSAGALSRTVSQEMLDLSESAAHFIYSLTSSVAGCVVIWAGSWAWDWRLGLLLTVAAPLMVGFLAVGRRCLDHGKMILEGPERELAARIVEFSRCQAALRSCRASTDFGLLNRAFDDCRRRARATMWWESLGQVLNEILVQVIVVGMIMVSAGLALAGVLDPLPTVATIGMCLRFTTMLENISASLNGIEERGQMLNHIDDVLDAPIPAEPSSSEPVTRPGAVALADVSFAYDEGAPVLDGVTLTVPSRTMCAVVGPSGSGKTTIARLIARFWDVDAGRVEVGGVDVRDLTTETLMEQLSMVFQDVYLFDDTLEANVRVGDPSASDEMVRRAADLAGVTEIVNRLPDGWDSRVGEGGRALSGGERQRVSIARALLKRAPIVLFDEATSALDAENEVHVVEAMEELRRTSTLIVIAHKLETIAAADQVVVLGEDGRIAQQGRHEDLIGVDGPYRRFWEYRKRSKGWALV